MYFTITYLNMLSRTRNNINRPMEKKRYTYTYIIRSKSYAIKLYVGTYIYVWSSYNVILSQLNFRRPSTF